MRLSFRFKLILAISAAISIALGTFTFVSTYWHHRHLDNAIKNHLRGVAATAAALIDVAEHERIKKPEDAQSPYYLKMITKLNELLATEPDIKYIYTLRPSPKSKGQKRGYTFVLDGGSAGTPLDPSNPDFSKIGDSYPKLPRAARSVFKTKQPAVDAEPAEDQWGITLSGYAPLIDANARVVAVLGVDMALVDLKESMSVVFLIAGVGFVVSILLGWGLSLAISRQVMAPFDQLYSATLRVADGNLAQPIEVTRQDEFALVLRTFNRMMSRVDESKAVLVQRAKLESQLKLAATVQEQLFRWPVLSSEKVKVQFYALTAEATGGDWAHYHLSRDRYLYMLCADVVGHGVGSAMLAAAVAGCFESLKHEIDHGATPLSPIAIMDHMQRVVMAAGRGQFPMTMFVLMADLDSGEMKYSGAAHPAARLISRDAEVPDARRTVTNLFMRADYLGDPTLKNYVEKTTWLKAGDTIVLFTDGLTERRNAEGEAYGARRLDRILRKGGQNPDQLMTDVMEDLQRFAGDVPPEDDISIMIAQLTRKAAENAA